MRILFLIIAIFVTILCTATQSYAKHLHKEREYQTLWCAKHKGVTEYRLSDNTRVDCLTENLAVEFDFANKWAECIGQALYYGQKTGKTPACVLIIENEEKDLKHLRRLRYTVYNKKNIPEFRTFTIKPINIYNANLME